MKLGFRQRILLILGCFLIIFSFLAVPVKAAPCAILKVSLPVGTYVGYNSDPWLSECWLLNLTGTSQTFTVRINNTSSSLRSYDTHFVIALNDAGYANLVSLVVNGTSVPKSAFKYGTPKPYNLWTWPSGDVYPTYFDDTRINVGLISKKGYKDLIVSVAFSDISGVRMHFDAYGKTVSYTPPNSGYITHNSLSEDATVLLQAGPPPPQPPVADFFFDPYYPETNQLVTFDASNSYDPDGYIVSYAWNFGDGSPVIVENDPVTTHVYTYYGDFTVTLTVTDDSGLTDDATASVHVSQHPIASFTFSPPDPLLHEIVTFDASASTPDGGVLVSYRWDFGDGNVTTESDPIITHSYLTYGTFTVTLNVTDSEGKWDTQSQTLTVEKAPIADFWWAPYYPQRDESVTFDASASTPDGGIIISYTWDFGDGNVTTEFDPIITHSYASTGDYMVTLNISDSEGRWDIESKVISVVPRRYFLEVKTDPAGITTIPGEGWYNEGTNVDLTAPDTVFVSTGVRYMFSYWDVDGISKPGNPITVNIDANHTATAHYVLQYYLTVTSPYGTAGGEGWYNADAVAYATLDNGIVDHGNGTRRVFTQWSGDASGTNYAQSNPIVMNAPKTAVAEWKKQYAVTFTQIGSAVAPTVTYTADVDPTETVPFTVWVKAGSQITYEYQGIVSGAPGVRYVFTGVNPSSPQIVNSPLTISGTYQVQYYLTVNTNPAEVLTLNPSAVSGQGWYDSGSVAVVDAVQNVDKIAGASRYDFRSWTGATPSGVGNQATVLMDGPKTATANYVLQYKITFSQTGVGTDFTGTVVVIDSVNYGRDDVSFWWDAGSLHSFAFQSPLVVSPNVKQYVWTSTAGLSTLQSGSITVSNSGSITGNYKTQYYFTVTSPSGYGSPNPASGWFDASSSITASVTSPWLGTVGTRYVCTGWTGTGSVPPSGTGSSVTFVLTQPSSITWNWVTQYYLTVRTEPLGIVTILGEGWYNSSKTVSLTAPSVSGYTFLYWDVDGVNQGNGVASITVNMNMPHTATAHYTVAAPPLSVSISPPSASKLVGQSVVFSSTVSGGTTPYTYQWYLNGSAVPGATSSSWTFIPSSPGTYSVYLKVTDAYGNPAQSAPATVNVGPAVSIPVGGYSISLVKHIPLSSVTVYAVSVVLFAAVLSFVRRKRK